MLEFKNVTWTTEDNKEILRDITFKVDENKFVVITGPNGGGKTTTAKMIAGIIKPTSGTILFDGVDITNMDATQRAKAGIGYAFQQPVRFKGITVHDLIEMAVGTSLLKDQTCSILTEVGLCANEYADREVDASLSGGEIKRIEIATVLARKAKLSVFDEPEAGIDLWSFKNLIQVFNKLRARKGGSILIVSHQERLLEIADEIIVVSEGKILQHGPREVILPTLFSEESRCNICPKGEY